LPAHPDRHICGREGTWWVALAILLAVFHRGPVVVCLLAAGQLGRETAAGTARTCPAARCRAVLVCRTALLRKPVLRTKMYFRVHCLVGMALEN